VKGFFFIIILAVISGLILYKLPPQSPCDTPISYKLGIIDTKFNLSESDVLDSVKSASDIWSKSYDRPLFVYFPSAQLTIYFVYDDRAALDSQIDLQKNKLGREDTSLQAQISTYEKDLAAFQKKLADFNTTVDENNLKGGVSLPEYNDLIKRRDELKSEGDALNDRATKLNLSTHNFNSDVQSLNQQVNQFNQSITNRPEEGVYDFTQNSITIYFADNHSELVHTLAHEFGHVLGMNHVADPQGIMYAYSTSTTNLTSQDKDQLMEVCKKQPVFRIWLDQVTRVWFRLFKIVNQPG
jgi:hypothetical protein